MKTLVSVGSLIQPLSEARPEHRMRARNGRSNGRDSQRRDLMTVGAVLATFLVRFRVRNRKSLYGLAVSPSLNEVLASGLLLDTIRLGGLAGFGGGAFLERGFPAQFHAAFVVDADALHPDHLADLGDVFGTIDAEIGQLGNVNEAILAREHFDERAEIFDRDDATVIGLADLDLARHAADAFFRACHTLGAGCV